MTGSRLFIENSHRSGCSGLSAARPIFFRLGARFREDEEFQQEISGVEHGGNDEQQAQPMIAKPAAKNRPYDEVCTEHDVEQVETAGALICGRDIGDAGPSYREISAFQTCNGAAEQQHPQDGEKARNR